VLLVLLVLVLLLLLLLLLLVLLVSYGRANRPVRMADVATPLQLAQYERTPYAQADNAVRDTCVKKRSDLQSEYDRNVQQVLDSGEQ
jgi:hypothetical protein